MGDSIGKTYSLSNNNNDNDKLKLIWRMLHDGLIACALHEFKITCTNKICRLL